MNKKPIFYVDYLDTLVKKLEGLSTDDMCYILSEYMIKNNLNEIKSTVKNEKAVILIKTKRKG